MNANEWPSEDERRELRRRVADHIEKHPELHNQESWGRGDPNECGTPCCVAGWACRLGGGTRGFRVDIAARWLLGVPGAPFVDFDKSAPRAYLLEQLRGPEEPVQEESNYECSDCSECRFCTLCRSCVTCLSCENCDGCESSEFCRHSTALRNCWSCVSSRDCSRCANCTECVSCETCGVCVGCVECRNCFDCGRCESCVDCQACVGCTSCSGCLDCTDCEDCISCTGCEDCAGVYGGSYLAAVRYPARAIQEGMRALCETSHGG